MPRLNEKLHPKLRDYAPEVREIAAMKRNIKKAIHDRYIDEEGGQNKILTEGSALECYVAGVFAACFEGLVTDDHHINVPKRLKAAQEYLRLKHIFFTKRKFDADDID